ncbi:unnamed protein product [Phyllotreta striolata]|uniref:Peptidase S1 domain-containing protein n=1 Tax=Phyllotreta striolata TaxID=444603 RepID=A0A9N9XKV8_PHYSR|nr:unnamed protein product [Phyllotreta striolata]
MLITSILVLLTYANRNDAVEHQTELDNSRVNIEQEIIGGYSCLADKGKYVVSITSFWGLPICSASLLNSRWILTAAHCNIGYTRFYATPAYIRDEYVDSDGWLSWWCPVTPIESVYTHPQYDNRLIIHDISLMKLSNRLYENKKVQFMPLNYDGDSDITDSCTDGTAVGFGTFKKYSTVKPKNVQCMDIGIMNKETCTKRLPVFMTQGMEFKICIDSNEDKDVCYGDSGGPLICQGKQIGIASYVGGNLQKDTKVEKRIVGGYACGTGHGQYGIALTSFWGMPICSASMLNPSWLLTAAHCKVAYAIFYASPAYIRDKYIDSDGWLSWSCPVVSVESIYLHPKYDIRYVVNDIALMKLSKPFKESPRLQYVKLDLGSNKQIADSCSKATAVGFGLFRKLTKTAHPMEVRCMEIGIMKTSDCLEKIPPVLSKELDHKICIDSTSQKDVCYGDSGGPLICQDEIIGYSCEDSKGQYGIALTSFWGMPICSASLLNPRWLLTAAHCKVSCTFYYASPAYIRDKCVHPDGFLKWSCPVVNVQSIYLHPRYDSNLITNDIALMKLSKPLKANSHFRYINLQLLNNKQLADSCDSATAVGFGFFNKYSRSSPKKVQCLDIGILKKDVCKNKIPHSFLREGLDYKICIDSTTQKDVCYGDSGGPLICQDEQIGIASYITGDGCASERRRSEPSCTAAPGRLLNARRRFRYLSGRYQRTVARGKEMKERTLSRLVPRELTPLRLANVAPVWKSLDNSTPAGKKRNSNEKSQLKTGSIKPIYVMHRKFRNSQNERIDISQFGNSLCSAMSLIKNVLKN